jgi:hypothetical protein
MEAASLPLLRDSRASTDICLSCIGPGEYRSSSGVTVWDLFYVGLTIVVFAVLLLIVKGVERFER